MIAAVSGARRLSVLVAHPGAEMFGSDRMLLESVVGLCESGARVTVTLPSSGPLVGFLEGSGAKVVVAPAFVLRRALFRPLGWPTLVGDLVRGTASSWRLIGRVRPDVILTNTIIEPLWPSLGLLRGIPVVTHVHEAEMSTGRFVAALLYLPHSLSTRLVVNSRFTRSAVARVLPGVARDAHVVLNGVEGPEYPTLPRAELTGELRVLYVGRLSPRKAPDLVLEAARLLREEGTPVRVVLVGDVFPGYEWYAERLRAQAAAMVQVEVEFVGFHQQVWSWLAESDVLVVPSREDESFGNTVVEGVLALRPVVASDMGGLREAAEPYPSVCRVAVDDARALARSLRGVVDHWEEVTAAVVGSRGEALRRHSPRLYRAAVGGVVAGAVGRDAVGSGDPAGCGGRRVHEGVRVAPVPEASGGRFVVGPRTAAKATVRAISSGFIRAVGVESTSRLCGRATVVLAPHPDDETFGCGATIARLRSVGVPVHVVFVSDGAASPTPDGMTSPELVSVRQREARAALAVLGVEAGAVTFWGLPDGALDSHRDEVVEKIVDHLGGLEVDQVLVTSVDDRHPDHVAVGLAAREAVARMADAPDLLEYAIWQRVPAAAFGRRRVADLAGRGLSRQGGVRVSAVPLLCETAGFLGQKRAAVAAYGSQLPHFPMGFVEDFLGPFEHFAEVVVSGRLRAASSS